MGVFDLGGHFSSHKFMGIITPNLSILSRKCDKREESEVEEVVGEGLEVGPGRGVRDRSSDVVKGEAKERRGEGGGGGEGVGGGGRRGREGGEGGRGRGRGLLGEGEAKEGEDLLEDGEGELLFEGLAPFLMGEEGRRRGGRGSGVEGMKRKF